MANLVYVDNSNVWIEGMHVAAFRQGQAKTVWEAVKGGICAKWSIDFGRLFEFACGEKSTVKRAALFGSRPPPNDSLWATARYAGFEPVVYDRNIVGKEKKVDTDIVATMVQDSYEILKIGDDEVTLVAGDTDYVPGVEKLVKRGIPVHVVFWSHASKELREAATKFIPLDPYFDHLSYHKAT